MIDHFGFRSLPFTREIAIRDSLRFGFLKEQEEALVGAAQRRMSALVVAPPGLGKSVILRQVKDRLPETQYQVRYLKVNRLSGRDLCREIAHIFRAGEAATLPKLVRLVQRRITELSSSEGVRPVIILDDAHSLREQGFELIKILTNFEMDSKLIVSFILAGHSSLKEKLFRPGMADVRQRISHCGQLRLLSREETADYIKHRLALVGCSQVPFDENAIELIYDMGKGNMRATDNIALKALGQAAGEKVDIVSTLHVTEAARELWN